jgi:hypothetical protein
VALSFHPSGFEEFFGGLAQALDDCNSASESFKPVPATVLLPSQPMQSSEDRRIERKGSRFHKGTPEVSMTSNEGRRNSVSRVGEFLAYASDRDKDLVELTSRLMIVHAVEFKLAANQRQSSREEDEPKLTKRTATHNL